EDRRVHEARVIVEEGPPQVVKLERFEYLGQFVTDAAHSLLLHRADFVRAARLDSRDDVPAVRGCSWLDGTILAHLGHLILLLEVSGSLLPGAISRCLRALALPASRMGAVRATVSAVRRGRNAAVCAWT